MKSKIILPRCHYALLVICLILVSVLSQQHDYGNYDPAYDDNNMDQGYYAHEEDNLYQNYLKHEEDKAAGRGGAGGNLKIVAIAGASWVLGARVHSGRAVKKEKAKHDQAQRGLYAKYLQDVAMLQTQNAELQQYIGEMTANQLNEEFLQADYDNDREVSRAEFELYKKQYLARHPEMSESQFPKFEDFDPNRDGSITMKEHTSYYQQEGHLI